MVLYNFLLKKLYIFFLAEFEYWYFLLKIIYKINEYGQYLLINLIFFKSWNKFILYYIINYLILTYIRVYYYKVLLNIFNYNFNLFENNVVFEKKFLLKINEMKLNWDNIFWGLFLQKNFGN